MRIMRIMVMTLIGVIASMLLVEALLSIGHGYETQQARIINTQDDCKWGDIGTNEYRYNETSNSWYMVASLSDALGETGETITDRWQHGTVSLLGLCGDVSYSQQKLNGGAE